MATTPMSRASRCTGGARKVAAVALLLCSCAVVPEEGWQTTLGRRAVEAAAAREDASAFATNRPDADVASGDAAMFEVTLIDGERRKGWRVEVRVVGVEMRRVILWRSVQPFEHRVVPSEARQRKIREANARPVPDLDELARDAAVARIRVEAFGGDGGSLGVGESSAVVSQLRAGLLAACRAGHRQCASMRGRAEAGLAAPILELDDAAHDDVVTVGAGVDACERFFRILRTNEVMKQILREVLAPPSLWSIVTNWGVRLSFSVDFFAAERVDSASFGGTPRELWSVPMVVLLNGQPGLLTRVVVGPSGSPDGVVAGVHAIVARHPTDPERRVEVRLLSTHRVP